jgi:hypothetical protein
MSRADLGIALPPTWRRRSDPDHGVLVAARATVLPASGVCPELTLTCAAVDVPLARWREQAVRELATRLDDFELEDEDVFDLFGHDVDYRRFAYRLGAADLLCDQWAWRAGPMGVTLTGTVARIDYWDYCDVFETVAETVDVSPRSLGCAT